MVNEVDLIISDLHAPVYHKDTVKFLALLKKTYTPQRIFCTGDEINWESISYHEKNPDLPGALDELVLSRKALKPIMELFPKMEIMESNHGSLPFRKAQTVGLPSQILKTYREILQAPKGWNWHLSYVFNTKLGPVYMAHGKTSVVGKLSKNMAMNSIQGHYHSKCYINYWASPIGLYWDMNVGSMADDKHLAMKYGWNSVEKSIMNCGILINGIPRLQPMVLDRRGNWIGRL